MRLLMLVVLLVASQHEHHQAVDTRGDKAMGFSHETTAHHFTLLPGGGEILIVAKKSDDAATIAAIRKHLREIAAAFQKGDFSTPGFIHAELPAGAREMSTGAQRIRYEYREVPSGAAVAISTADADLVSAIHRYMRYQITEHRTGDPADVQLLFAPKELTWTDGPPSLPKGAKMTVLEGDPREEGIFTMRIKLPANYRIAPHWHPAYEHVTVIEGVYSIGKGETFNEAALRDLPAGGFSVSRPGDRHFVMSRHGAVVQIHAFGPWQIIYVDPKDDPRR